MKSKVYFTKTITPEKVLEMYEVLGKELKGNIAVKLHSGEEGNQNFLKPDFWRPIIDKLNVIRLMKGLEIQQKNI